MSKIFIFVNLFLVFLLTSCTIGVESNYVDNQNLVQVTYQPPSIEAYPAPLVIQQQIAELEQILAQENISELERNNAEGLLTESNMIATKVFAPRPSEEEVAQAFDAEMTRLASLELTPIPPTITPQLGILPSTHLAYQIQLPHQILVKNIWQGYIKENLSLVYAGQLWPDARTGNQTITYHGAIAVTTYFPDGTFSTKLYATDEEVGPLTIQEISPTGEMVLVSEGYKERKSETIYFDLSSETFSINLPTEE